MFHAGNDGKVRAYDEDTGEVLWTGIFNGTTSGVPVSYESKGRQYFVIMSNEGGGGGRVVAVDAAPPPEEPIRTTPTGAIAYALPEKK